VIHIDGEKQNWKTCSRSVRCDNRGLQQTKHYATTSIHKANAEKILGGKQMILDSQLTNPAI
jgi:hypothetical protein